MINRTYHIKIYAAVLIAAASVFRPFSLQAASPGLNFKDCYELAVKQSELLLESQEDIEQAKLRRRQTLGSVLPNIHWVLARTLQDQSGVDKGQSTQSNTSLDKWRTTSEFTAHQPIFQGFKEFSAMSAYKAEERKNEALLMRQTVNLYLDVAQAFFRVLQLEQFLADTRTSIGLTEDRIKELHGRVRLGKSRDSEILSAESQLASLKSVEALTMGDIISARDVLGFYIGRNARPEIFVDDMALPTNVDPEEKVLKLGMDRSDVRAVREDAESKRYAVRVAKSGFYPGMSLDGNYYTQRNGFLTDIDWDVTFNLDVPIFQGGSVSALVKEAQSVHKQSELELRRTMRFAESEIRQTQANLASSISETLTLEDAYTKAKKSYEAQTREYRLGLVNNLDVLAALNTMQQTKASYDTSYLQTKLNQLKLKAVIEEIP